MLPWKLCLIMRYPLKISGFLELVWVLVGLHWSNFISTDKIKGLGTKPFNLQFKVMPHYYKEVKAAAT